MEKNPMVQAIVVGERDLTLDALVTVSRDHAPVAIAAGAVASLVADTVAGLAGVLGFVSCGVVSEIVVEGLVSSHRASFSRSDKEVVEEMVEWWT
jgi:hypothetical protein